MDNVRIGIIGIGGFAITHINSVRRCAERGLCDFVAVVARQPYNSAYGEAEREQELRAQGVRVYRTYQEMLDAEHGNVDVVTVPLGIALHAPVSIDALRAGYHVMCEKPAAGSTQEAVRMLRVQQESGRTLAIGYQHVLSSGIQFLKSAALSKRFGNLLRARTIIKWPRDNYYYNRNEWAGKLTASGRPIYDSPVQNAAAHYLQNMLYVAGPSEHESAFPAEVYAENYRANGIESADTQFVRVTTERGLTLTFVASHALRENLEPYVEFEFEKVTIAWDSPGGARLVERGGRITVDLNPELPEQQGFEPHDMPFVDLCHALADGRPAKSTISNAIQHLYCVESAFVSSGGVHPIPRDRIEVLTRERPEGSNSSAPPRTLTVVNGLEEILDESFSTAKGPGELGVDWGRTGRPVRPDHP